MARAERIVLEPYMNLCKRLNGRMKAPDDLPFYLPPQRILWIPLKSSEQSHPIKSKKILKTW